MTRFDKSVITDIADISKVKDRPTSWVYSDKCFFKTRSGERIVYTIRWSFSKVFTRSYMHSTKAALRVPSLGNRPEVIVIASMRGSNVDLSIKDKTNNISHEYSGSAAQVIEFIHSDSLISGELKHIVSEYLNGLVDVVDYLSAEVSTWHTPHTSVEKSPGMLGTFLGSPAKMFTSLRSE